MPLSPIKLLTSKFKSPTATHSSRFSSSHRTSTSSDRRSRSHDPPRRSSRDEGRRSSRDEGRRASYARPRSPDPSRDSRRHERRSRYRDSSDSSPEPRYAQPPPRDRDDFLNTERWEDARGRRRASLAPPERSERPPLSGRPSSVDYRRRPSQSRHDSGYGYDGRDDPRRYERRPSVQESYRPERRYSHVDSPPVSPGRRPSVRSPRMPRDDSPPRSSRPHASPRPSEHRPYEYRPLDPRYDQRGEQRPHDTRPYDARPHDARPHDARPHDARPHDARPHDARPHDARPHDQRPHSQSVDGKSKESSVSNLFTSMPAAIAAYAGLKEVSKHAETAKEWIDWLNQMSDTPEEIQELSAQAATARDTINQVQLTLKARPDLVEGEQGEKLKEQIESSIKNTDKALEKMTKLLSEIGSEGTTASGSNQTAINQMQSFWRSYKYKDEFEEKVKKAQEEVQKELSGLSTLMVNIYSRALMKPAPPGASPVPPPAPTPTTPSSQPTVATANAAPAAQPTTPATQPTTPAAQPPTPVVQATPATFVTAAHPAPAPAPAPTTQPPGVRPTVDTNAPPPVPKIAEPTPASPQVSQPVNLPAGSRTETSANAASHPPQSPAVGATENPTASGPSPQHTPAPAPPSPQPPASSPAAKADASAVPAAQAPLPADPRRSSQSQSPRHHSQSPHPQQPSSHRNSIHSVHSNQSTHSKQSPEERLLDAAEDGDLNLTKYLLQFVSPRTCDDQGLTPLHVAADRDHLGVALLLLDNGADVNARTNGGRTALHFAARAASAPMVEALLEKGPADPNVRTAQDRTPLHYAASKAKDGDQERRDVIRVLRDWGADPTIKDIEGATPRDLAQKRNHLDAAGTLKRAERQWEEDHMPQWEEKNRAGWLQRHGFKK